MISVEVTVLAALQNKKQGDVELQTHSQSQEHISSLKSTNCYALVNKRDPQLHKTCRTSVLMWHINIKTNTQQNLSGMFADGEPAALWLIHAVL